VAQRTSSNDRDPQHAGVIEVRVRDLIQLFDSMDPSPFHEKDLDGDAEEYIVSSANELPGRVPFTLVVHVERASDDPEQAAVLRDAVRDHFARQSELSRRALRRLLRRGWISLLIGLSFLAAALLGGAYLERRMGGGNLATMLREGLLIGGWVAMWRPMEIFLYDWWVIRGERRIHDRLSRLDVRIVGVGAHR
jgi:hypothetical protein